jgi:hypothetical protein
METPLLFTIVNATRLVSAHMSLGFLRGLLEAVVRLDWPLGPKFDAVFTIPLAGFSNSLVDFQTFVLHSC